MKIEKRETKEGFLQITTLDERWYEINNDKFYPSVTWITQYYPKGVEFYKWLANKGWDEAEAIKSEAGARGSRVHHAIEMLIHGKELDIDTPLPDFEGEMSEITPEDWEAIMSFVDWWKQTKPKPVATEYVVHSNNPQYAGTVDFACEIDGKDWIIDFKTSQQIWPSHELQLSAYKHAIENDKLQLAILQVGYRRNKRGWKFNEIEDKFELFESAYKIWHNENKNKSPKQMEYPMKLKLEGIA